MEQLQKDKLAGEEAAARSHELERDLMVSVEENERHKAEIRELKSKIDQQLHASRMQQELLNRQRDEARDEAATLRTSLRKAKGDKSGFERELLAPLQAEIKSLHDTMNIKVNLLKKAEAELAETKKELEVAKVRTLSSPVKTEAEEAKVELPKGRVKESVKKEVADVEQQTEEAWPAEAPAASEAPSEAYAKLEQRMAVVLEQVGSGDIPTQPVPTNPDPDP